VRLLAPISFLTAILAGYISYLWQRIERKISREKDVAGTRVRKTGSDKALDFTSLISLGQGPEEMGSHCQKLSS
jgi:hypothetical protein